MTAVLTRARAELRARLISLLALTLLVGFGSGAVMTIAAGARRTDTAYPRFARAYKAADMRVYPAFDNTFASLDFNAVQRLPEVAASSRQHFLFADNDFAYIVDEPPLGVDIDRYKILEGRAPLPDSINEGMLPYWVAQKNHWHIGSLVTFEFATLDRTFLPYTLRIVGIEAAPGEFPPQVGSNGPSGGGGNIHVGPGVYKALQAKSVFSLDMVLLRFKRGAADNGPVNDKLNEMATDKKTGKSKPQLNDNLNDQATDVQRSIHLQAVALWLVAGFAALIIALVLSQLIARQASFDATENPTLLALGMSRTQVWLTGMTRALVIGVAGAALAVLVAYLASPLMPLGIARIAEPAPGFSFDATLLVVAAAVVISLVLLLAAWPIWKSSRAVQRQAHISAKPSLAARTAAVPGLSPAVGTGVRLALESGKGRTQVPVRSSLFSVILAIAALAGALSFGASLDHLLTTPRLYGWNWDLHLTTQEANDNTLALSILKPDPRFESIAQVATPPVYINSGRPDQFRVDAIGLTQEKGDITAVRVNGTTPHLPDEIALGVKTLGDARAKIGDSILVSVSALQTSKPTLFKIVGTVILPPYSSSARLGSGVQMTEAGFERTVPSDFKIPPPSDLFIKFAAGVDQKATMKEIFDKLLYTPGGSMRFRDAYGMVPATRPTDLVNFGQVQNLPLLLAGLVGLLAAATLAHTLVTSIRRRRRDLAILKMLGFVPRQVRWAVAWQATTFVAVALLIGLPVGIALGRVVWSAFATNLGTLPEPVTPSLSLLLTIPGAILLANLIAVAPAVIAGRRMPAPALRTE